MKLHKKILALVLTAVLLLGVIPGAGALTTQEDKEARYAVALAGLESYLENPGDPQFGLDRVLVDLKELNKHFFSQQLYYYAYILKSIENEDYGDYLNEYYLGTLLKDTKFAEYLNTLNAENSPIYDAEVLCAYYDARKAGWEGDIEQEAKKYDECIGFYDANDRKEMLLIEGWTGPYEAMPAMIFDPAFDYITVGTYVTFGRYEQDNVMGNGQEAIEWLALELRDRQVLLLSVCGLDCQRYHSSDADVTWENCSLRSWLNGSFMNMAFNAEEKKVIVNAFVDNGKGQGFSDSEIKRMIGKTGGSNSALTEVVNSSTIADGGSNTIDSVFLLSVEQARSYLVNAANNSISKQLRVSPTDYALSQGAKSNTTYGVTRGAWWLRSPGRTRRDAAAVFTDGDINYFGIRDNTILVRPALWVDLDLINEMSKVDTGSRFR